MKTILFLFAVFFSFQVSINVVGTAQGRCTDPGEGSGGKGGKGTSSFQCRS